MHIYAPVICPNPNYVGGDSVTVVFNHTYNMGEMLGQRLPWAISSLGNIRCIRRLGTKKKKKKKKRGNAFSLVLKGF